MTEYVNLINAQKAHPPIDLADIHLPFAWLVFRTIAFNPNNIWGAHRRPDLGVHSDFDNNSKIRIKDYDGHTARFCRVDNAEITLEMSNFRSGKNAEGRPRIEKTGKTRLVQGVQRTDRNLTSFEVPASDELSFEVGSFRNESEALELAHKQMASLTIGGQIKVVTVEATVGVEESQTTTSGSEEGSSISKGLTSSWGPITLPPGKALEVTGTRELAEAKLVIEGDGEPEFNIVFGIHRRGRWKNDRKWERTARWDSKAEMLEVFKGKGPRHHNLALEFREHPAPGWLMRPLLARLNGCHYRIEQPFEDPAIDTEFTYREV